MPRPRRQPLNATARARRQRPSAPIDARLAAFDSHRDDLLIMLQKVRGRQPRTEALDANRSWRKLRWLAFAYFDEDATLEERRALGPFTDREEQLTGLGAALKNSRRKLTQVTQGTIRGALFLSWCEAHGNPDLTDPIISRYDVNFEELIERTLAAIADLEKAALRAPEQLRQSGGRPEGTGILPHDFIINLECAYRDITGKPGGAGDGPFARFVKKFSDALGQHITKTGVKAAIQNAKEREEQDPATSRWGRSWRMVGKTLPHSRNLTAWRRFSE
jgi:hypothetical protein